MTRFFERWLAGFKSNDMAPTDARPASSHRPAQTDRPSSNPTQRQRPPVALASGSYPPHPNDSPFWEQVDESPSTKASHGPAVLASGLPASASHRPVLVWADGEVTGDRGARASA